ncbi:MAG TPA: DUF4326 domain-containing protein [Blastocatellia bacterium]|nr:DUF4326 domain-containing protein [Blastocatellia bacterium]
MIRIENRKTYRGQGVYIGRPSLLGNPFRIGEHGTREEVIARYRSWLWRQIRLRGEVYRELQQLAAKATQGDLVLICWCKNAGRHVPCHGDIIQSAVEWMISTSADSSVDAGTVAEKISDRQQPDGR